jgi:hypothetical protein
MNEVCRFWNEKKKQCLWNFFVLYYRRKEVVVDGHPFFECTDGLNEYHPTTLNTVIYCQFYQPKKEEQ